MLTFIICCGPHIHPTLGKAYHWCSISWVEVNVLSSQTIMWPYILCLDNCSTQTRNTLFFPKELCARDKNPKAWFRRIRSSSTDLCLNPRITKDTCLYIPELWYSNLRNGNGNRILWGGRGERMQIKGLAALCPVMMQTWFPFPSL